MDGTTYTIKTVSDFLSIPPDRRDVAMHEFKAFLAVADAYKALLGEMLVGPEEFIWIDDGKGEARVVLTCDGEEIYSASGVIA